MSIYQAKVYQRRGGAELVVPDDCLVTVEPGASLDVEAGGGLRLSGSPVTSTAAEINALAGLTSTAAEINSVADVSGRVQTITASGPVTPGIQSVELNHASVPIEATIANSINHQGLFVAKNKSAGAEQHTLTLTSGTFDGTNHILYFTTSNDALVVYFDSAGVGHVISISAGASLGTS